MIGDCNGHIDQQSNWARIACLSGAGATFDLLI